MVEPISPKEALEARVLPDWAFDAINALIIEEYKGSTFRLSLEEVEKALMKAKPKEVRWSSSFLDFERFYNDKGWSVHFDAPGYNETGTSTYVFKPMNR